VPIKVASGAGSKIQWKKRLLWDAANMRVTTFEAAKI